MCREAGKPGVLLVFILNNLKKDKAWKKEKKEQTNIFLFLILDLFFSLSLMLINIYILFFKKLQRKEFCPFRCILLFPTLSPAGIL